METGGKETWIICGNKWNGVQYSEYNALEEYEVEKNEEKKNGKKRA